MKILIDEDVFSALKSRAIPFQDHSPNDVIRRLLGITKKIPPTAGVRSRGSRRGYFADLILEELEREGGVAVARNIVDVLEQIIQPEANDREKVRPGIERWRKDVHFARLALVKQGMMSKNSARGSWELTELGRTRARELLVDLDKKIASERP